MTTTLAVDQLPMNGIELVGLAIITVAGIVHLRLGQRGQARQLDEVHTQISNDHPAQPNMRDTIDNILEAVHNIDRAVIGMRIDVAGLRDELREEINRSISRDDQIARELHDERQRSIIADAELQRRTDAQDSR